jgi:outer membrane protein OmpA-like peptidoglycan-associated protein
MFQEGYNFLFQCINLIKQAYFFRFCVVFILIYMVGVNAEAQNLFANADFEHLNNCTEYHQDCASEAWFYIKPSATPLFTPSVVPKPFSGKDLLILPIENIYDPQKKRQFVYTMFCCELQKEKNYKLSFYVNTAGKTFYGMDFYFQKNEFTSANFSPDSVKSSIHISAEDVVNELGGWNYVEKIYTATGKEKFCLIGNLAKKKFDFSPYQRMNKAGDIFYFIDDIVFESIIPQPLCADYKINLEKLYAQNFRHTELVLVENKNEIVTDTITVPAPFFETDKSILKPVFKKLLDSLVINLNTKNVVNIIVEGHTDSKGTLQRNAILSTQRAEAVRNYFLNKMPELKQIIAYGKASAFPVADNITEKGRAQNRRVKIILVYTNKSG